MATNNRFGYKSYVLCCAPMPMTDGTFSAQIVIEAGHGGPEIQAHQFSLDAYFASEEEAAKYSYQWGVRWVDKHG